MASRYKHRRAEVGRNLWRSSNPTTLLKQRPLEPVAQDQIWRVGMLLWRTQNIAFPNIHLSTIWYRSSSDGVSFLRLWQHLPLTLLVSSQPLGEQRKLITCMGCCSPLFLYMTTKISDISDFFFLMKWSYRQALNSASFQMDYHLTRISPSLVTDSLDWKLQTQAFWRSKRILQPLCKIWITNRFKPLHFTCYNLKYLPVMIDEALLTDASSL